MRPSGRLLEGPSAHQLLALRSLALRLPAGTHDDMLRLDMHAAASSLTVAAVAARVLMIQNGCTTISDMKESRCGRSRQQVQQMRTGALAVESDGATEGATVGTFAGATVGTTAGAPVGALAGAAVGALAGATVDTFAGATVGTWAGTAVGTVEGTTVGATVGTVAGTVAGASVGTVAGAAVGA